MRVYPHQTTPLSTEQVRSVDAWAARTLGLPGIILMENAGRSVAEVLTSLVATPPEKPVLILCGPGNNGGDGLVMARHLHGAGWPVFVVLGCEPDAYKGDALFHCQILFHCGIAWERASVFFEALKASSAIWDGYSWVVDALFGTGLKRALISPFFDWVEAVNRSGLPVLSVDLPSGLDGDTGQPLGTAIRATHTVAMVALRMGFAEPRAKEFLGTTHVASIGLPAWEMTSGGPTLANPKETGRMARTPNPFQGGRR
jgi:NAD(P)H-hydrate epimerase